MPASNVVPIRRAAPITMESVQREAVRVLDDYFVRRAHAEILQMTIARDALRAAADTLDQRIADAQVWL
jgi:hypothetical protein